MTLGPPTPVFITCSPGPSYFGIANLAGHNITQLSDPVKAALQHDNLIRTIERSGKKVITLAELPNHPNSVFTKDTAICTPRGYILVRMGLPTRMGEEPWMAEALEVIGIHCIGSIEEPGTVEGGDIILTDNIAFIGHSTRTNQAGVEQISNILKDLGYETRIARVPAPFLHLGGTMTLVSPDTILHIKGLFPDAFFQGFQLIEVPNTGFISGNVIPLSNHQAIAHQTNIQAIRALKEKGFSVFSLDLSEFVKGTGGPSCLIMEVR